MKNKRFAQIELCSLSIRTVPIILVLAWACTLFSNLSSVHGQNVPAPTVQFPMPIFTGNIGEKQSSAMEEVTAYIQATSSSDWHSLEASGTLSYPDSDPHRCTLFLSGGRYSRLDVEFDAGIRSLRIHKYVGEYVSESGRKGKLPPMTASTGVVAFPLVWADALRLSKISLLDRGTYAVEGRNLHRITIKSPLLLEDNSDDPHATATDLYFDPSTHLLLYSVDAVVFDGTPQHTFIRVTAYENYQKFSGTSIPATIRQFLDGQMEWSLSINQAVINTNISEQTFAF